MQNITSTFFLKLFKASEAISYDWTNVFRCV